MKNNIYLSRGNKVTFNFTLRNFYHHFIVLTAQNDFALNQMNLLHFGVRSSKTKQRVRQSHLGTIPILRQHIFGLFLTHPLSINTVLNVSKNDNFPTPPPVLQTVHRGSSSICWVSEGIQLQTCTLLVSQTSYV